jgi:hypothetical protein
MGAWAPTEIAPQLWRWTAPHPDWVAGAAAETPEDWDRLVGSTACVLEDELVFFDPLLPEDREAFWRWVDELARSRRVHVLTTLRVHRRDRESVADRYGASTSRAAAALPDGLDPKPLRRAGEVTFWIDPHRALVVGDRILGDGRGGLRLCPDSWLRHLAIDTGDLAEIARPLLELPIERVIVSHGEPVLSDGRDALRQALG